MNRFWRADADFARRAAEAFSRDNIGQLRQQGIEPTFADLRLAFLLGAGDAARVIRAAPDTPTAQILSSVVLRANPFMGHMSTGDLLAKSVHDVEQDQSTPLVVAGPGLHSVPPQSRRHAPARTVGRFSVRDRCNTSAACSKVTSTSWKRHVASRPVRRGAYQPATTHLPATHVAMTRTFSGAKATMSAW